MGQSPWGHKESDMTERLNNTFVYCKASMLPQTSPTCAKQQGNVSGKEQHSGEPYLRLFWL